MADGSFAFTPAVEDATASLWQKVKGQVTPLEWRLHAPLIAEINRLKANAQDDIASMAQRAREELRERVGALAVQGATKIVQREIDASAHKAMLDQLAAEI